MLPEDQSVEIADNRVILYECQKGEDEWTQSRYIDIKNKTPEEIIDIINEEIF